MYFDDMFILISRILFISDCFDCDGLSFPFHIGYLISWQLSLYFHNEMME